MAKTLAALSIAGYLLTAPAVAQTPPPPPVIETNGEALAAVLDRATRGEGDAALEVATRYFHGVGGAPQDDPTAIRWFTVAAKLGNPEAQVVLGRIYQIGFPVGRDLSRAASLFRQAADQGYADGQYELAMLYLRDQPFGRDLFEYERWLIPAAEQGHVRAQEALADLYIDPNAVGLDYAAAFRLYTEAANAGNADAQFDLGVMYGFGEGMPADPAEAYFWISLSIEHNPAENRINALERFAAELSAKQISALDRRIAAFVPVEPRFP